MPLKVYLSEKRSPYWRIRGTVRGERVDESSGYTERRDAEGLAERREAEIIHRQIHGAPVSEKREMTFATAVINFVSEPGRAPSSKRYLRPLVLQFGMHKLSEIDQAAVDGYVRTLSVKIAGSKKRRAPAPASVLRLVVAPISAVMNHAGVPIKLRRPKVKPTKLRYLTEEEAARLVQCAADHLKPLITFCLNTGARMGEALALEWGEVDLAGRRVVFRDTKNGEARGLPLNDAALAALANLDHREGRVFLTNRGASYPLHDNSGGQIKTGWAAACRRAGIKGATPHTMRHTFASWLVIRNTPLRMVAELLGHKSLSMVMRYSHLAPQHLAAAVDGLGKLPGQQPISSENDK